MILFLISDKHNLANGLEVEGPIGYIQNKLQVVRKKFKRRMVRANMSLPKIKTIQSVQRVQLRSPEKVVDKDWMLEGNFQYVKCRKWRKKNKGASDAGMNRVTCSWLF